MTMDPKKEKDLFKDTRLNVSPQVSNNQEQAAVTPAPQPAPVQPQTQTVTKTTTKQRVKSEDTKKAEDKIRKAQQDYMQAGLEQAQAEQTFNNEIVKIRQQAAEQQQRDEAKHQQIQIEQQERLKSLQAEHNSRREAYRKQEPKTFWGSKDTGNRMLAAISLALGTFASNYTGVENTALKVINSQMDEFRANEEAKRQKQLDMIKDSGLDIEQQQKAIDRTNMDYNAKQEAARIKINDKIDLAKAKTKNPTALANLHKLQASFNIDTAQDEARRNKEYEAQAVTHVTQTTGPSDPYAAENQQMKREAHQASLEEKRAKTSNLKAPKAPKKNSEGENKAAGFASRMQGASNAIKQLEAEGYDRTDKSAGIGQMMPNLLKTDAAQRWAQAQEDWVSANLRRESGAVIGEEEMEREIAKYFPLAGDSAKVVEQKRKSRERAEAGMRKSAGTAIEGMEQPETRTVKGVEYVKVPGGWKKRK